MKYNTKYSERYKSFQIWKIGYPIDGVWFNISSAKADGKYLTVTKIGNLKELTMEKGGTVCIANYMLYQRLLQCISWQSAGMYPQGRPVRPGSHLNFEIP